MLLQELFVWWNSMTVEPMHVTLFTKVLKLILMQSIMVIASDFAFIFPSMTKYSIYHAKQKKMHGKLPTQSVMGISRFHCVEKQHELT